MGVETVLRGSSALSHGEVMTWLCFFSGTSVPWTSLFAFSERMENLGLANNASQAAMTCIVVVVARSSLASLHGVEVMADSVVDVGFDLIVQQVLLVRETHEAFV